MATRYQSGSGEDQNIGAVKSFEGKKRGAINFKLRIKNKGNMIKTCKMCLSLICFGEYMIFIT